jgi:hypothetical protein
MTNERKREKKLSIDRIPTTKKHNLGINEFHSIEEFSLRCFFYLYLFKKKNRSRLRDDFLPF